MQKGTQSELLLYRALVSDLAHFCAVEFEPVKLQTDGGWAFDTGGCATRVGAAGEVFFNGAVSRGEYPSHVLWVLGVAEPIHWTGLGWERAPATLRPTEAQFFRLCMDEGDIPNRIAQHGLPAYPSLNYVLATHFYVWNWGGPVDTKLWIPAQRGQVVELLRQAGYLGQDAHEPSWTPKAALALRQNWYALQGGDLSYDNGEWRITPSAS